MDEKLRQTALKALFSEPQFNVMDGLDTYIDDYSKPDPIPEAMLRRLNQAKDLFLFDDEKQSTDIAGNAVPAAPGSAATASVVEIADASALAHPTQASACAQDSLSATAVDAAPPAPDIRKD